jgi:hypothetical protein
MSKITELFHKKLKVINIGLEAFKDSLKKENIEVIQIDWRPPTVTDSKTLDALNKLLGK